jgi:hypothetical protein
LGLRWRAYDYSNFCGFIAAEYISSHSDGYPIAVNNYWVYRPSEGSALFIFPHTLDNTFRASYWVLTQRAKGAAGAAFLREAKNRDRVVSIISEYCSGPRLIELKALISSQSETFLDALLQRDPVTAASVCKGTQWMKHQVDDHFRNLGLAIQMDKGIADCSDDYRHPEKWFYGDTRKPLDRQDSKPELKCLGTAGSRPFLQCYVIMRPGTYRWIQPVETDANDSVDTELSLDAIGSGIKNRLKGPASRFETAGRLSLNFSVTNSASDRLFSIELVRLRVELTESNRLARVNIPAGLLQRVSD